VNVCDIDKQVVHGPGPFQPSTTVTASHYLPAISFFPADNIPFQSYISPPTFDMTDQPGSSHLHVLFEAALEEYKQQTGIQLAEHPLAERLQDHNSVESVTAILREHAQDFKEFQDKDKILTPLKKVLTVLNILPSTADFAQDVGLVRP
jgi:hypothetical protein